MTSSRLKKCLICNNGKDKLLPDAIFENVDPSGDVSSRSITEELSTLFVVRNLLGISSRFCQELLPRNGNPSSWGLSYCSDCVQLIQEAQMIFQRIRRLIDHFDELKENLRDVMRASVSDDHFSSSSKKIRKVKKLQRGHVADKLRLQFHIDVKKTRRLARNVNPKKPVPIPEPLEVVIQSEQEDSNLDDDEPHYVNEIEFPKAPVNDFSSSCPICKRIFISTMERKKHLKLCTKVKKTAGLKRSIIHKVPEPIAKPLEVVSQPIQDEWISKDVNEDNNDVPFLKALVKEDSTACPICEQMFLSGTEMREHLKLCCTHTKKFECDYCGAKFLRSIELQGHESKCQESKMNKNDTVGAQQESALAELPEIVNTKGEGMKMSLRQRSKDKTFSSYSELASASESEPEDPDTPDHDDADDSDYEEPATVFENPNTHKSRKVRTSTNDNLPVSQPHSTNMEVICKDCGRTFKKPWFLNNHRRGCPFKSAERTPFMCQPHPTNTEVICKDCGRTFKKPWHLNNHRRGCQSKSIEKRPFMCEICSKSFSMQLYLSEHQQGSHYEQLGLDPYKCSECGKVYNSSRNLDHHMKMVHLKNGYLFQCDKCPRGFMFNNALQNHIRICHTREKTFKCTQCPKAFLTQMYLGNHLRTHSIVKPWNCPTCSKAFSDSSTYKRHLEIHGSTVHECPTCGKTFKVRHAFRLHMKSHSKSNATGSRRKPRRKVVGTTDAESSQQLSQRQPQEDVTDSSLVLRPPVQSVTMEVEIGIPTDIATNNSTIQSSDIMSSSVNNDDRANEVPFLISASMLF